MIPAGGSHGNRYPATRIHPYAWRRGRLATCGARAAAGSSPGHREKDQDWCGLRLQRTAGGRFSALIGHGAGYGVYDKLKEGLGNDVNYFFNVDPISIWLTSEKALKPGLPEIIKVVGEEYTKARPGTVIKSAHVGMAASNTYVLLTEVLPLAIKKYGGFDADALRKAALEVDLPEGGTMPCPTHPLMRNDDSLSFQIPMCLAC